MERFPGGATGALRAIFPFLTGRGAGVEARRKHRLTHAGARPDSPNLRRRERTDRRYGQHIKLPHRVLVEHANAVKSAGGLVHFSEDSTFLHRQFPPILFRSPRVQAARTSSRATRWLISAAPRAPDHRCPPTRSCRNRTAATNCPHSSSRLISVHRRFCRGPAVARASCTPSRQDPHR